ncbi:MAG TPA: hypothetical protein PKD70_06245 [Saprospiraceae bacterium]|nr:hypothetical protein [Saprospiraceae bacterium]HMP13458.1 hypothetical protein [Saprospiraceae bacterium]
MKRRKQRARMGAIKTGDFTLILAQGAMLFGGYAVGKTLNKNIDSLQQNPLIGAGVQIAAGVFTPTLLKTPLGNGLGLGMIVAGLQTLISETAPSLANAIGVGGIDYNLPPAVLPRLTSNNMSKDIFVQGAIVDNDF